MAQTFFDVAPVLAVADDHSRSRYEYTGLRWTAPRRPHQQAFPLGIIAALEQSEKAAPRHADIGRGIPYRGQLRAERDSRRGALDGIEMRRPQSFRRLSLHRAQRKSRPK